MPDFWGRLLIDQLDFYMATHLMPRLDDLTDDEYFWRPVDDCWSLEQDADGQWYMQFAEGEVDPTPMTTIGWCLAHIAVENLGSRVSTYFGDGSVPDDVDMFDERHQRPIPGSADEAVALLTEMHTAWRDGLRSLDDDQFAAPLGRRGGPFAADSMAALVLHVGRETMHHGGEIGVLRDLYLRRKAG